MLVMKCNASTSIEQGRMERPLKFNVFVSFEIFYVYNIIISSKDLRCPSYR